METGYTVVQDWMLELDLDLRSTFAFAIIYGFSQDGISVFSGTHKYLANKCKCSRRTIIDVLQKLEEKGYIEKIEKVVNGVTFYDYKAVYRELHTPCKNFTPPVKKFHTQNIEDNNKEKDNTIVLSQKKESDKPDFSGPSIEAEKPKEKSCAKKEKGKERFDFEAALVAEGVSEQTASDWLEVRAKVGGVNTLTAFRSVKKELDKAKANGVSADECIAMAVTRAWRGFEFRWYMNEINRNNGNGDKQTVDRRRSTDVMDVPIEEYYKSF
jgi:DNA-binding Lrp family transcriptional regulator|nr:MAG TPA_asm: helix-turn-helix domain protein [Caudoviricetes sp.]